MDIGSLFSVEGKVALVTGASHGLGAMIAEGLVRAGARVYVCARKEERLRAASDRLTPFGTCHPIAADLGTEEGIARLAQTLGDLEPQLDILVNNAGTSWGAPLDDFPAKGFSKILQLNVTAPFLLTQALLPMLRAAASVEQPARVINIASIDGMRPPHRETYSYSASKAGLIMLTRHLAKRLAPEHISVNAISPGLFETPMTGFIFDPEHPHHEAPPVLPLGERTGTPEDIVGAVIYMASRAGAHLTGINLPVSGGEATAE